MDFNHTPQKETTTSALQKDQIFPSYHRILEKEYYMRKKLSTNALNTLNSEKLKNLYRKFFGGFTGKVGWKEGQRSGWNIRKI